MAATLALTARTWSQTPSSLLGLPAGSLGALSLDSRLAVSLQQAEEYAAIAAAAPPDDAAPDEPDAFVDLPPYMRN
jgi:hypothetical protein